MLLIVVRKLFSNKWMLLCTLTGAIITVAMLSSIPTYTEGIMQRMLTRDLEISQTESGKYPGGYLATYGGTFSDNNAEYDSFNQKITGILSKSIDLPILTSSTFINACSGNIRIPGDNKSEFANFSAITGLNDHIRITHGRAFSNRKEDGAYEAVLSEEAAKVLGLTLGNTYEIDTREFLSFDDKTSSFKIKIVGIFSYKSENDAYWYNYINSYNQTVFMDFDLLKGTFLKEPNTGVLQAQWYFAYDYHRINLENLPSILSTLDVHKKWFENNRAYLSYTFQAEKILDQYGDRAKRLNMTLLVLQMPILLMLAFYTFMVAKLKIDFESNEIAVIKSRGGSSSLVFRVYLSEVLLIGLAALAAGPFLGLFMCRIIGSSNGFLEFVQRSALPLALKPKTYLYSIAGVIFISVSMLIPAIAASRTNIVLYKQNKSRKRNVVFWKKFFIDIILLAVSAYGLYGYQRQQKVLFLSGLKGAELGIDPLLFLVSFLFVLGCGLFVLRLFPYMVRVVYFIGRRFWSPGLYATFLEIGRSAGREQFTMIFLILTLSIGIFGACSARTINKNIEDKVRYKTGADIVVQSKWTNNKPSGGGFEGGPPNAAGGISINREDLVWFEPPYKLFTQLNGVESATKVFKNEDVSVYTGDTNIDGVSLMGIIPDEFGRTAWFDSKLLPHHWYNYLNLMTDSPTAMLVSKAFKDNLGLKEGDSIYLSWGDQRSVSGIIYAFIDYWPAFNPNRRVDNENLPYFAVANLNYIQAIRNVEPYEVWMKKKTGASSNEVYKSIEDKKIELASRTDATELIINQKNDPSLQGTNGSLTLGFIVTIIITVIGFLIHWIMSLKRRVLQFGIFRAMGVTSGQVIGMITFEQILVTGTSIAAGLIIGSSASRIFVPMLQLVYSSEEQVPPFKVVSSMDDYMRLFFIIAVVLIACFTILKRFITSINIGQAIKLGED